MIESLAAHGAVLDLLKQYDIRVKKHLGQNFLTDRHVLNKIMAAADISHGDTVVEVGPGLGALTLELSRKAGRVMAIETDGQLVGVLTDIFADCPNVRIIHADVLKYDMGGLFAGESGVKVVANLPYYITSPVIMSLLPYRPASITVMVQKEVADRLAAKEGTKDYGALTIITRYYADVRLVANVPRNCFIPRPNVDSAVIKLDVLPEPRIHAENLELFFSVVKAAFSQRRKTLTNCLSAAFELNKAAISEMLDSCGIDRDVRGEALTIFEFEGVYKGIEYFLHGR